MKFIWSVTLPWNNFLRTGNRTRRFMSEIKPSLLIKSSIFLLISFITLHFRN
jgi:hypothetical protein